MEISYYYFCLVKGREEEVKETAPVWTTDIEGESSRLHVTNLSIVIAAY